MKIVELGSFSAAARVLHVAQPALTRSVFELETHLGVNLLLRSSRGVTPTLEGDKLCKHAYAIFRHLEQAEADVRSLSGKPRGNVLIALPLTLSCVITAPLLGMAIERYPEISLEITDQLSSAAAAMVETGRVDFAVLPNAAEIADTQAELLYRESLYLIGRAGTEPGGDTVRFAELSGRPLVLPSRATDIRRRIEEAAIAANQRLDTRFEQNSNETIRAIVAAGLAHTILPWYVFDPGGGILQICARRIIEPEIARVFSIVWGTRRPLTVAAHAVKELLKECVAELQRRGELGEHDARRPRSILI